MALKMIAKNPLVSDFGWHMMLVDSPMGGGWYGTHELDSVLGGSFGASVMKLTSSSKASAR